MTPTKRQIARVIRKTAQTLPDHPKLTAALFAVCSRHGSKASTYYDNAVKAMKAFGVLSFSQIIHLPEPILQRRLRNTARALEHGLRIES